MAKKWRITLEQVESDPASERVGDYEYRVAIPTVVLTGEGESPKEAYDAVINIVATILGQE